MSDDLNREFAMWTNFPFSASTIPQSNPHNSPAFSPERDTASRSRHKALEDFSSSAFFGSVGAALAAAGPSEAAHERAKLQQLQHHMGHNHSHPEKPYHPPTSASAAAAAASAAAMNDLFSSFMPYNADGTVDPFVDPFLTPNDYANTPASGNNGGGGGGLPPLTVRHPRNGDGRPVQGQHGMQTIDPATTTLSNRPTAPLPTKRAKPKAPAPLVIPVDREYAHHNHTAPASTFEDEDMDMQDNQHDIPLTDANGMPLSAAEDKRRRNTLASARFRQKKKEREAAMERKARELDDRVSGLERECESLRKENKMLRGLLVDGVPAAAANIEMDGLTNTMAPETSANAAAAANASGASVVLLEELVRLLKANSAVLTVSNPQPQGASAPSAGPSKSTTTGKRKRGSA